MKHFLVFTMLVGYSINLMHLLGVLFMDEPSTFPMVAVMAVASTNWLLGAIAGFVGLVL